MAAIDPIAAPIFRRRSVRAALCAVLGMGLIGVVDNVMLEVFSHIGLAQFHFVRSAMALAMLPLFAIVAGVSVRPVNPLGVLGRSVFLTLGMTIYFACIGFMPVAEGLAGVFTAPLFVMLLSWIEGRRLDAASVGFILLGFVGCLAVVQPDPGRLGWLALGPIAAGFFYGLGGKVTRSWTGSENPWTLVTGYLALIGAVGGIALLFLDPSTEGYVLRGWAPMTLHVLGLCFAQAVVALVAMSLLTRAYQLAAPAFVGAFEYTVLIVAAGTGYLVWGHVLNLTAVLGVVVILIAGAALAVRGDRGAGG